MEILDLYDKDLKFTGQTIERGQRVPPGLMIPIVAVYVYNNQGQYLIQKVAPRKGNYYSTTAGHVKSGERDFALAMLREMKEEIGLSATKSELKLVKIRRYDYKFTLLYMLKSNVPAEMLRLQKEEVDSVMWMSHEDIELLCKMGLFNRVGFTTSCCSIVRKDCKTGIDCFSVSLFWLYLRRINFCRNKYLNYYDSKRIT